MKAEKLAKWKILIGHGFRSVLDVTSAVRTTTPPTPTPAWGFHPPFSVAGTPLPTHVRTRTRTPRVDWPQPVRAVARAPTLLHTRAMYLWAGPLPCTHTRDTRPTVNNHLPTTPISAPRPTSRKTPFDTRGASSLPLPATSSSFSPSLLTLQNPPIDVRKTTLARGISAARLQRQ